MGFQFPGKKRYVTLEWPLRDLNESEAGTFLKWATDGLQLLHWQCIQPRQCNTTNNADILLISSRLMEITLALINN